MDTLEQLDFLISQVRATGQEVFVDCTHHMAHELRRTLSSQRKYNPAYYGVEMGQEVLPQHMRTFSPAGGVVKYRIVLRAKEEGKKVRGPLAAQLREAGVNVDHQTVPVKLTQEEIQRNQEEIQRYMEFKEARPNATFAEKCAAGFERLAALEREYAPRPSFEEQFSTFNVQPDPEIMEEVRRRLASREKK